MNYVFELTEQEFRAAWRTLGWRKLVRPKPLSLPARIRTLGIVVSIVILGISSALVSLGLGQSPCLVGVLVLAVFPWAFYLRVSPWRIRKQWLTRSKGRSTTADFSPEGIVFDEDDARFVVPWQQVAIIENDLILKIIVLDTWLLIPQRLFSAAQRQELIAWATAPPPAGLVQASAP